MNSPIPWSGGKASQAKKILPHIAPHVCWCEPFAGGLGMLFNKPESKVEVINDIHQDLVNLFRVAKYHPAALEEEMDLVPYSRAEFMHLRDAEGSHKTDVQRAAWFFATLDMSFGAQGFKAGYGYSRTKGPVRRRNYLAKVCALSERLDRVNVECLDYAEILKRYDGPETFFFIDPPYIGGSNKQYSPWTLEDLGLLEGRLKKLKGKWLVTMSDSDGVRDLFAGCRFVASERQNGIENRKGAGRIYKEVFIMPKGQTGGAFA